MGESTHPKADEGKGIISERRTSSRGGYTGLVCTRFRPLTPMYLLPHDLQVSGYIQQIGKRMTDEHLKRTTIEMTFQHINPELIKLMTGEGEVCANQAGLTIHTKIKRTFWQWLRRRPVQWKAVFIPASRITFDKSD